MRNFTVEVKGNGKHQITFEGYNIRMVVNDFCAAVASIPHDILMMDMTHDNMYHGEFTVQPDGNSRMVSFEVTIIITPVRTEYIVRRVNDPRDVPYLRGILELQTGRRRRDIVNLLITSLQGKGE